MRRLIAILLFAAFVLPFALPALALGQDADAGLPACCRRDGAHHCAMNMAERERLARQDGQQPHWRAPLDRCPYCPAAPTSFHANSFPAPGAEPAFPVWFSHPSGVAQTESRRRIARDRSRQKRGPPVVSLA